MLPPGILQCYSDIRMPSEIIRNSSELSFSHHLHFSLYIKAKTLRRRKACISHLPYCLIILQSFSGVNSFLEFLFRNYSSPACIPCTFTVDGSCRHRPWLNCYLKFSHLKLPDQIPQRFRLSSHFMTGRGTFFRSFRIYLNHMVNLIHTMVNLIHCTGLLF